MTSRRPVQIPSSRLTSEFAQHFRIVGARKPSQMVSDAPRDISSPRKKKILGPPSWRGQRKSSDCVGISGKRQPRACRVTELPSTLDLLCSCEEQPHLPGYTGHLTSTDAAEITPGNLRWIYADRVWEAEPHCHHRTVGVTGEERSSMCERLRVGPRAPINQYRGVLLSLASSR